MRLIDIGFNSNEIELLADPEIKSGLSKNFTLSDWKFTDWKISNAEYSVMEGSKALPSIVFTVTAKRGSGFYLLFVSHF